jgi:hypothetical protein
MWWRPGTIKGFFSRSVKSAFLKRVARLRGTKSNDLSTDVESYQEAEECVLKYVQSEAFGIEIDLIRQGKPLKGSPIANSSSPQQVLYVQL